MRWPRSFPMLMLLSTVRAGKIFNPSATFSLLDDGLYIQPNALTNTDLRMLYGVTKDFLMRLKLAVASLNIYDLRAEQEPGGFCWGDVVQRGAGQYELRVHELDLRPPDEEPVKVPAILATLQSRWWPTVVSALGDDAELRSATIVISTNASFVTGTPSVSQPWQSAGTLPPEHDNRTYALVVTIPLQSVVKEGGRVQYLPRTHSDRSIRVEHDSAEWTPAFLPDVVTPTMEAGTAVTYSYATQHRGLANRVPGSFRPVLKLDYFRAGARKRRDSWCEDRGFLLDRQPEASRLKDEL